MGAGISFGKRSIDLALQPECQYFGQLARTSIRGYTRKYEESSMLSSIESASLPQLSCSSPKLGVSLEIFETQDGQGARGVLSGKYNKNLACKPSKRRREKWSCVDSSRSSDPQAQFIVANVFLTEVGFERAPGLAARVLLSKPFPLQSSELAVMGCKRNPGQ